MKKKLERNRRHSRYSARSSVFFYTSQHCSRAGFAWGVNRNLDRVEERTTMERRESGYFAAGDRSAINVT